MILRKEKQFLVENRKRLESEFQIEREKQFIEVLDREKEVLRLQRQQQSNICQLKLKGMI